jgi:hypothetical protein
VIRAHPDGAISEEHGANGKAGDERNQSLHV